MATPTIHAHTAKDGTRTYWFRLDYRDPVTGERKQPRYTYASRRDAERERTRQLAALQQHGPPRGVGLTFGEYAAEWSTLLGNRAPGTVKSYRSIMERYLMPAFGHVVLRDVSARHIELALARWESEGAGASTLRHCHARMVQILTKAVRDDLVPKNVAQQIEPPAYEPEAGDAWTQEEAARYLEAAAGGPYPALAALFLGCGLRRGEAIGLRWADVDRPRGVIRITQQVTTAAESATGVRPPKGKKTRLVYPPPSLFDLLDERRAAQDRERAAAGASWTEEGLVFTRADGRHVPLSQVWTVHHTLIEQAGVRPIRLHDLRHTFATLALDAGQDLAVVSEALGHANIAITLTTYRHVVARRRGELASCMESLLFPRATAAPAQAS